jgi:transcriptional regulator with XRE-family HTH domain
MEQRRRIRPANLANKLRQIRLVLGLSQSELLRRLDAEELMHYGRISDYELGKREPALWILLAYARVAGIHLEDLVDDNISLPTDLPGNVVYTNTKPTHRRR